MKEEYKKGKISDVEVKEYLFECLIKTFAPARARFSELNAKPEMVKKILADGAVQASDVAAKTMKEVRDAVGLTNGYSFQQKYITIDELAKVEMRVGKVLEAINKEGSDKLIRFVVDIGEEKPRIIFTGVRGFGYTPEDFAGKQFFFITNLTPAR
jgi:methionyl-tRNA synthetase